MCSISNIRGATSTVVEITVTPNSNDVVPVRDQIVEIDIANSTIQLLQIHLWEVPLTRCRLYNNIKLLMNNGKI